ncbi:MAG TPA: CHASE3 domain-containing protein, partial [Gemmatimonadaceae bacterium]|nr:CHASE3 domain-containing protein [Gemmatimonadaceae bacterium]
MGFYSLESRVERATFRSRELARISRDARSLSVDQETGLRGYLISGNVILLAPKKAADRAIGPKLDTLATLTADNRSQHDRAIAIRRAVSQWNRGYVAPTLERMSRHEPFSDQRDNLAGKELFDGVRGTLDSFIGYQETRYRALLKFDVRLRRTALGLILIEIVIIGVASLASGKRAARHTRQLLETQAMLEEQAVEMEYQTEQLQDQAVHLEEHAHEAEMALKRLADSNKHLEATIAKLQRAEAAATRASAARDETQSLLDSLFDASPVGFGLLDRSLKYTAVNAAMADLCGMPATDVLGIGPRDLVGPETGEEVEAVLRNVMNTGDPVVNVPVRGVLLTDPNIERHWMLSYFPVGKNADGVLGVGIVAVETTDRKRLEDQLRQAEKMEA